MVVSRGWLGNTTTALLIGRWVLLEWCSGSVQLQRGACFLESGDERFTTIRRVIETRRILLLALAKY